MKKVEAVRRRAAWARALEYIAFDAGKDSSLYKILGTVAWGRFDGEPSTPDTKDNALFGLGFLHGVRYAALQAARLYNLKGERELSNIHERIE